MRNDEIRQEILFQAYAIRPLPISATQLERQARKNRLDFSRTEIARELPFLCGEKLISKIPTPGVTEDHYEITSDGIRHYENNYAA